MVIKRKQEYREESVRLKSYNDKWTADYIDVKELAAAGFYYVEDTTVKCFECGLSIDTWTKGDNIQLLHYQRTEHCKLVYGMPCGNVPLGVNPKTIPKCKEESDPFYDNYYKGVHINPDTKVTISFSSEEEQLTAWLGDILNAKYPQYSFKERRLATFANWPASNNQRKETLVAAGLIYLGKGDKTMCYYCGGTLWEWDKTDNPEQEHIKWYPKCMFIRRIVKD